MEQNKISYADIPLFQGLNEHELDMLLHCLHRYKQNYKKGEYIHFEQDRIEYVGVILSGRVHMLKEDIWGHETLLAYLGHGELMGETFALQKESNAFHSFVAGENCVILFLAMQNLLHACPRQCSFHSLLIQNMFDLMGKKNIKLLERSEIISKPSLRGKILAFLSLEAQKQQRLEITLPLNRSSMAQYLQCNRSAMTRELSRMQSEGLLTLKGQKVTLKR